MTPTEQQILALLERRQGIDKMPEGSFTGNHRWLIEATDLLLRHQLELREEATRQQLTKADLCKEITKEVLAALRNHLVIPLR